MYSCKTNRSNNAPAEKCESVVCLEFLSVELARLKTLLALVEG